MVRLEKEVENTKQFFRSEQEHMEVRPCFCHIYCSCGSCFSIPCFAEQVHEIRYGAVPALLSCFCLMDVDRRFVVFGDLSRADHDGAAIKYVQALERCPFDFRLVACFCSARWQVTRRCADELLLGW
jgi:hypothetical protein